MYIRNSDTVLTSFEIEILLALFLKRKSFIFSGPELLFVGGFLIMNFFNRYRTINC